MSDEIELAVSRALPQIDSSAIEWTGVTWNPWQGCIKVSEGCKYCYMYRDKRRYGDDPAVVVRSADGTFYKPLKWQKEVEEGRRVGRDRFVFTCSWSDFFIEEADEWRPEAWEIMHRTPDLTYQVLTKRAERIDECLPGSGRHLAVIERLKKHVLLGVSIENQERADERLGYMEALRAQGWMTFVSYEPALGAVDWGRYPRSFDWLIAGGESGPEARASHPDWFREARDFCVDSRIPFFFKQWGEWAPYSGAGDAREEPWGSARFGDFEGDKFIPYMVGGDKSPVFRIGKKAAGRVLDGRVWDEMPGGF